MVGFLHAIAFIIIIIIFLVTAIGGSPKPEMCFLPGRLR